MLKGRGGRQNRGKGGMMGVREEVRSLKKLLLSDNFKILATLLHCS